MISWYCDLSLKKYQYMDSDQQLNNFTDLYFVLTWSPVLINAPVRKKHTKIFPDAAWPVEGHGTMPSRNLRTHLHIRMYRWWLYRTLIGTSVAVRLQDFIAFQTLLGFPSQHAAGSDVLERSPNHLRRVHHIFISDDDALFLSPPTGASRSRTRISSLLPRLVDGDYIRRQNVFKTLVH